MTDTAQAIDGMDLVGSIVNSQSSDAGNAAQGGDNQQQQNQQGSDQGQQQQTDPNGNANTVQQPGDNQQQEQQQQQNQQGSDQGQQQSGSDDGRNTIENDSNIQGYKAEDGGIKVRTKDGKEVFFDNESIQTKGHLENMSNEDMFRLGQGIASAVGVNESMQWLNDLKSNDPIVAKEALEKITTWSNMHTELQSFLPQKQEGGADNGQSNVQQNTAQSATTNTDDQGGNGNANDQQQEQQNNSGVDTTDLQKRTEELVSERDNLAQDNVRLSGDLRTKEHSLKIEKESNERLQKRLDDALRRVDELEDNAKYKSVQVEDPDIRGIVDMFKDYKANPDGNVEKLVQVTNMLIGKFSGNKYSLDRMLKTANNGNKGSFASHMTDNTKQKQQQIDDEQAKKLRFAAM